MASGLVGRRPATELAAGASGNKVTSSLTRPYEPWLVQVFSSFVPCTYPFSPTRVDRGAGKASKKSGIECCTNQHQCGRNQHLQVASDDSDFSASLTAANLAPLSCVSRNFNMGALMLLLLPAAA
jgi:hypothetical protein